MTRSKITVSPRHAITVSEGNSRMSESTIRAQIYSILNSVEDIGKVYDYERWSADWTTFINLFKTAIDGEDQIRGWEIGRRSVKETKVVIGLSAGGNEKAHGFLIRGYLRVKDAEASEKTFSSLIEAIGDAFRSNPKLNQTAERHDFIQADPIESRVFGGVLCHYAELTLTAYERI
jgi:hypothetical protein